VLQTLNVKGGRRWFQKEKNTLQKGREKQKDCRQIKKKVVVRHDGKKAVRSIKTTALTMKEGEEWSARKKSSTTRLNRRE